MRILVTTAYVLVGLVNLAPVIGLAGRPSLEALYGASIPDPTLLLLMQHRAVLFGLIGGAMILAAFREALRPITAALGGISMAAFLILFLLAEPAPAALQSLFWIDLGALFLLLLAVALGWRAALPSVAPSGAG